MCGLEAVLSYNVARWVRKLQVRLKGRRYKVRKNNERLWDAYRPWIHQAGKDSRRAQHKENCSQMHPRLQNVITKRKNG